jgi:hypothetical protein
MLKELSNKMQDVFNYRDEVIKEYQSFSRSFTNISAPDIKAVVDAEYEEGRYWPEPLIQINPNYKTEKTIDELCADGTLESECRLIFQVDKKEDGSNGKTMTLYSHQQQAIAFAALKQSYVVTTGTGSGKSLSFFIPKEKTEDSEEENPWNISFLRMYDMSNDSGLFETKKASNLVPLYEAKMMHQFDHRWGTFESLNEIRDVTDEEKSNKSFSSEPEFWVSYKETILRNTLIDKNLVSLLRLLIESPTDKSIVLKIKTYCTESDDLTIKKLADSNSIDKDIFELCERNTPKFYIGWRDVTNATAIRTGIFSVVPFSGIGNNMPVLVFDIKTKTTMKSVLLANFNSLVLDYIARFKVGGLHLSFFIVKQLPILPPETYTESNLNFIVPRVMALTYTATDMTEWAKALWNDSSLKMRLKMLQLNNKGNEGITDEKFVDREFSESFLPPYIFDDAKRAALRSELDAYYARLYGLKRTELQYILEPQSVMGEAYPSETFRVLKDNEIAKYGEFRTQRLVLEAWDKME